MSIYQCWPLLCFSSIFLRCLWTLQASLQGQLRAAELGSLSRTEKAWSQKPPITQNTTCWLLSLFYFSYWFLSLWFFCHILILHATLNNWNFVNSVYFLLAVLLSAICKQYVYSVLQLYSGNYAPPYSLFFIFFSLTCKLYCF